MDKSDMQKIVKRVKESKNRNEGLSILTNFFYTCNTWDMQKIAEREKANIHQKAGTFPDHAYSVYNKKTQSDEIGFHCLLDAESFAVENIGSEYTIMKYDRMVGKHNRDEYDWEKGYSPYPNKVDVDAVD